MSTKFAGWFSSVLIHYQFNFGDPRPHGVKHSDPVTAGVQKSHLAFFFTVWHKLTEYNKVLIMVDFGMSQ